jgi:hypothetical protein
MASNVQVKSTIKLNEAKINELTKQQYISLAQTADALLGDIRDEQLMPFDTDNLQNRSTDVEDSQRAQGRVSVVSTTPYARRLYFHPEYDFRRNNNARAGGQWFEPYINGAKKEWVVDTFRQLFKRNGGL